MTHDACPRAVRTRAPLLLLLALAAVSCRDVQNAGGNTTRADAGRTEQRTCTQTSECGGEGICIAGVCQQVTSCTADRDCAGEGKVCHSQRFYCVACDGRSGQCPSGKTCQFDFTCVDINSGGPDAGTNDSCSGTCSDRGQCSPDQVCRGGACCAPPSRCRSPADCPSNAPECNGATGQCFGGQGCFDDGDCADRAGCAGGACFCDIGAAPPGTCRIRPDACQSDRDCFENGAYAGKFCALDSSPRQCLNAPGCTSDADCAAVGLVCDTSAGSPSQNKCVNGTPCPNGNECGANQVCVGQVCVGRNCQNTPTLCQAGETCDPATLRCVPAQGGNCTSDAQCPQGTFCDGMRCAPGCRSNADCNGGVCNAQNQCENAPGGLCGPCMSNSDCPTGTICGRLSGRCVELCASGTCMMNPAAQCTILFCSCP
jgi:hypothetical protein